MIYVCENDKHAVILKSIAPCFSFRDMLYIRPQLRSYVICNRIVVAIFVRAPHRIYTGERRSFDQLETLNTIPLLNANADMPRQAHTCGDRTVVSNMRALGLTFVIFGSYLRFYQKKNLTQFVEYKQYCVFIVIHYIIMLVIRNILRIGKRLYTSNVCTFFK